MLRKEDVLDNMKIVFTSEAIHSYKKTFNAKYFPRGFIMKELKYYFEHHRSTDDWKKKNEIELDFDENIRLVLSYWNSIWSINIVIKVLKGYHRFDTI